MSIRHRSFARRVVAGVSVAGAAIVAAALPAHATWSVIGSDPDTGQVGVAVASCVPSEVVVVPVLVPGTGAAASQAALNGASGDQLVADLQAGRTAQEVIAGVTAPAFDPAAAMRQFGAVTLTGTAAGFTGSENPPAATTAQNASNTASVQGNTLVSDAVVTDSLAAFEASAGQPLPDRLLAALSAGSAAGGDSRCGERTASSAALLVAKPGDPVWNQTAAGFTVDIGKVPTPSIFVSVVPSGSQNPVTVLSDTYRTAAAEAGPGGEVKVQELPWNLSIFGLPKIFLAGGAMAIGVLAGVLGFGVWIVVRLLRRRRRLAG